jgi:hypothetical protein
MGLSLSRFHGSVRLAFAPTACAVGYIVTPLRGCAPGSIHRSAGVPPAVVGASRPPPAMAIFQTIHTQTGCIEVFHTEGRMPSGQQAGRRHYERQSATITVYVRSPER